MHKDIQTEAKEFSECGTFVDAEKFEAEYFKLISDLKNARNDYDSSDESDDDFGVNTEPEDFYDSPFEMMDVERFIKNALQDLAVKNPGLYASITTGLTEDEVKVLAEIFEKN